MIISCKNNIAPCNNNKNNNNSSNDDNDNNIFL